MMAAKMLLSVLFVSGVWAACDKQKALSIKTPEKMEALSGSCLLIPCNFKTDQSLGTGEIFGVWIKNDPRFAKFPNNVIFNSSKTVPNTYPMTLCGELRDNNCSTLFSNLLPSYTDKYFFRIQTQKFMATAACHPLQITVRDSPPTPTIEVPGDLKENASVTITCSAVTPCPQSPPRLSWNLQKDSHNTMERQTDQTFSTKIQETISLTDQHDGFIITCSVSYPVHEGTPKTVEKQKTLNVSYAPKNTTVSISPSGLNLSCSSRAKPPVSSFTWFMKSRDGDKKVSEGHIYNVNVTDGSVYYCVAANDLGKQQSKIHLTNGETRQPGSREAVVGGIIGTIILISVVVATWWCKSKHRTSQMAQVLREPAVQESARTTEKEDLHYAMIDFQRKKDSKRPEPAQVSVQDGEQLYVQVNKSKTNNSLAHTSHNQETIYAEVKK